MSSGRKSAAAAAACRRCRWRPSALLLPLALCIALAAAAEAPAPQPGPSREEMVDWVSLDETTEQEKVLTEVVAAVRWWGEPAASRLLPAACLPACLQMMRCCWGWPHSAQRALAAGCPESRWRSLLKGTTAPTLFFADPGQGYAVLSGSHPT